MPTLQKSCEFSHDSFFVCNSLGFYEFNIYFIYFLCLNETICYDLSLKGVNIEHKFMKSILLFLLLFITVLLSGQNINTATPFSGQGNSCVELSSPYSLFYNQAGISRTTHSIVGLSYSEKFHEEEFSTKTLFAIHPFKWAVAALDYERFGSSSYYEEQFGLSIARLLTKNLSLGFRLKYAHSFVNKYKNHHTAYNVDMGIQYTLPLDLVIAIHITNPFIYQDKLSEQLVKAGIGWVNNNLTVSYEYDIIFDDYDFHLFGLSLNVLDNIDIRAGYSTIGNTRYMGVGYLYHNYYFSISFSMHESLGVSSAVSVHYEF